MRRLVVVLSFVSLVVYGEAVTESLQTTSASQSLYHLAKTRSESLIEHAVVHANALYGKEPGFLGVARHLIEADSGARFLYVNIKGGGDCGFYALGITREQLIRAMESYIDEHDGYYRAFLKKREGMSASLFRSGSTKSELEILRFEFDELKSETGVSDDSYAVRNFNEAFEDLLNNYETISAAVRQAKQTTISGFVENIEYPGYEAFLAALTQELIASGILASDLSSKDSVITGVRTVFEKNAGSRAWLPGGLLGVLKDKLGLEYNIWANMSPLNNLIRLISGGGEGGQKAVAQSVRHVFFTGYHYDMLIPLMD